MALIPEDVSSKAVISTILTMPHFLVGTSNDCNRPAGFRMCLCTCYADGDNIYFHYCSFGSVAFHATPSCPCHGELYISQLSNCLKLAASPVPWSQLPDAHNMVSASIHENSSIILGCPEIQGYWDCFNPPHGSSYCLKFAAHICRCFLGISFPWWCCVGMWLRASAVYSTLL